MEAERTRGTPGIAGEGKRRHRAAHRARREGIAGTRCAAGRAGAGDRRPSDGRWQSWKRRSRRLARRMQETNQQREAILQARSRERERAIESGRQVILRLLGEASTLKNQLAQIEEYLAGIERETARAARGAGGRRRNRTAGHGAQAAFGNRLAQRQLELETVTGERRRTEEDLAERRRGRRSCGARSTALKTEVSQDPRPQGIARPGAGASHLHHRIGEAPVRVAWKRARPPT